MFNKTESMKALRSKVDAVTEFQARNTDPVIMEAWADFQKVETLIAEEKKKALAEIDAKYDAELTSAWQTYNFLVIMVA